MSQPQCMHVLPMKSCPHSFHANHKTSKQHIQLSFVLIQLNCSMAVSLILRQDVHATESCGDSNNTEFSLLIPDLPSTASLNVPSDFNSSYTAQGSREISSASGDIPVRNGD